MSALRKKPTSFGERVEGWKRYNEIYKLWEEFSGYQGIRDLHVDAMDGLDPVCEAGCGVGVIALPLLKAGHTVYAVDSDRSALHALRQRVLEDPYFSRNDGADEIMRQNSPRRRLYIRREDIVRLPRYNYPDGMMGGVVSSFTANFVGKPDWNYFEGEGWRYLEQLARITRSGGRLSLCGPIPGWKPEDILAAFGKELDEHRRLNDPSIREGFYGEEGIVQNLISNKKQRSVFEPDPDRVAQFLRDELNYDDIDLRLGDVFAGQSYYLRAKKR